MNTCTSIGLSLWFVLTTQLCADVRIQIDAGGHDRENCPVACAIPDEMKEVAKFTLSRESDGNRIPVQRFGPKKSPRIMWTIHDRIPAGQSQTYTLSAAPDDGTKPKRLVRCKDDGSRLTVSVKGSNVLSFNHAVVEAPDGIDSVYRRSGYFHPIQTPQGNTVTGDFEPDHPHQHGLFNAWVNATFRDEAVDFWNQAKGKGDVEFKSMLRRKTSGPVFAQFTATLSHVAIRGDQRIPAVEETIVTRVYNSKPFLFDIVSRQTTATGDPVHINEYHYGGFGIRGPSEWLASNSEGAAKDDNANSDPPAAGDFLTSSGRTRVDGNHTRARWVEMHGPIGSQHAGIIVMASEANFRAPQTVRLHPTKPYFCFAPMVLGDFSLKPNKTYTSRFRYVVHDGPANAVFAERMWQDYAHPPKIRILP